MSFIKMLNSKGLRRLPCGTLHCKSDQLEHVLLHITLCLRSCKNDLKRSKRRSNLLIDILSHGLLLLTDVEKIVNNETDWIFPQYVLLLSVTCFTLCSVKSWCAAAVESVHSVCAGPVVLTGMNCTVIDICFKR